MAGGPGTPRLAAAVSNAGGLGFVAGGHLSAEQFVDDIAAARAGTTGPIGANLLVPQHSAADIVQLNYYAEQLDQLARHYQVEVGQPRFGDDDDWKRKLEAVADVRPEVVSFTFGTPPPNVLRRLGALGMLLFVTVTSAYEASVAVAAGADGLVVQGPEAGGHMTSPIRRAAAAVEDPHGMSLWAGTGFASARTASAADIVASFACY